MPSPELLRMQSFLANSGLDRGARGFAGAGETMSRTSREIADRMMEAKMLRHQLEQRAALEQSRQMQEAILSVGDSIGRGLDRRADRQFRQQQAADDAALKRELSQAEIDAANQRATEQGRMEADDLAFRKQKFQDELTLGREELASREKIAQMRAAERKDDPKPWSPEGIADEALGLVQERWQESGGNPEAVMPHLPLAQYAVKVNPESEAAFLMYFSKEQLNQPVGEAEEEQPFGLWGFLTGANRTPLNDVEPMTPEAIAGISGIDPSVPGYGPPPASFDMQNYYPPAIERPLPLVMPVPQRIPPQIPEHYPGPMR